MNIHWRFAIGLMGCGVVWMAAFLNLPASAGSLLGVVGGSIAGWQIAALLLGGGK